MNIFDLEIWDDEGACCTFYTVRKADAAENETDKFFDRHDALPQYRKANRELLLFVIEAMGETHGAIDFFFNRPENEVKGLPPKGFREIGNVVFGFPDFPLRLYALRITEEIVVLFNGGVKDGPTNQTSSLHHIWKEACAFAKRISEAIHEETIIMNREKRILTLYDGSQEICL